MLLVGQLKADRYVSPIFGQLLLSPIDIGISEYRNSIDSALLSSILTFTFKIVPTGTLKLSTFTYCDVTPIDVYFMLSYAIQQHQIQQLNFCTYLHSIPHFRLMRMPEFTEFRQYTISSLELKAEHQLVFYWGHFKFLQRFTDIFATLFLLPGVVDTSDKCQRH